MTRHPERQGSRTVYDLEPDQPPAGDRQEHDVFGELERTLDRTAGAPEPAGGSGGEAARLRRRIATEPDTVERDLIKLVLTVVELVRQLMERQALRRVDQGDLTEDQEERIGMTLMLLEDRMTELRERYGLSAADLNLDLGPLGSLLPEPDRADR
ncbi:gas vesicle protein K [Allonocardiopsis opalescens]|uniref:Gas vesicle protein GvpK n=1 Tax=Allonocardiopsis opalescens TaxID=1144618 RepID=A0A2T0QEJ9_9ACTN|nr:gas vesicle protein K [Allonocardiopsis opalescens]PRY02357.1 gas vesicle protein GvpK [Allonocardiopsis opalescens]